MINMISSLSHVYKAEEYVLFCMLPFISAWLFISGLQLIALFCNLLTLKLYQHHYPILKNTACLVISNIHSIFKQEAHILIEKITRKINVHGFMVELFKIASLCHDLLICFAC